MRRSLGLMVGGLLAVLAGVGTRAHAGLLPAGGDYAGRTYNGWQVLWRQTALARPVVAGDHPLVSGGALGERDGVVMLTGVVGVASLNLALTDQQAVLFPIINIESSVYEPPPFHGDDEAELRANSEGLLDQTSGRFAEIDGTPVDLSTFRFVSPLFEWGPLPTDNVLGAPGGTTSLAVDAGYYLLVTPLTPGEHTIRFGGTYGGSLSGSIDTTYHITVTAVPEPASVALLSFGGAALLRRRRA